MLVGLAGEGTRRLELRVLTDLISGPHDFRHRDVVVGRDHHPQFVEAYAVKVGWHEWCEGDQGRAKSLEERNGP